MRNESPKLKRHESSQLELESGGLRNLPWKPSSQNALAPKNIDIEWLAAEPLLPFIVPVLPAQALYQSLRQHGFEDSIEIVEWIRGHQLHQILDYDLWQKRPDLATEVIVPQRVIEWFRMWLEIGPGFAAERVFELEEDLCVSIFASLFEIQTEGLSAEKDNLTDDYFTTPDNRFHLRLRDNSNPEHFEVVHQFVRILYGKDARQASQTFAYSAMLITQESLENELRWRKGRMADSGFVDFEEAMNLIRPRSLSDLNLLVKERVKIESEAAGNEELRRKKFAKTQAAFLADIEPEVFDAVVDLMRSMEPEMTAGYVQHLLSKNEIQRQIGTSEPTPHDILEDGDLMLDAAEKAVAMARARLSVRDVGIVKDVSESQSPLLLVEKAMEILMQNEPETVLDLKTRFARLGNTLASALSPSDCVSSEVLGRTLEVLRGVLNIGLQLCLLKPAELGLTAFGDEEFEEVRAASLLKILGPEVVFQIGWQRVGQLPLTLVDKIEEIHRKNPEEFAHLKPMMRVKFSDEETAEVGLKRLVSSGRLQDVRKWLAQIELDVPAPTFWVISALVNRIPLFPEAFESSSRTLRPFANVTELVLAEHFINGLEANLT